jgi:hypothetical protein
MTVQTFELGVKKPYAGRRLIPPQILGETTPGVTYEVEVQTKGIPDPKTTAETLLRELPNRIPHLKIHYINVTGNTITLQIEASPISWSVILAVIPSILTLLGIAVILIAVYYLFAGVPGWVWGLLILGAVLLFVIPTVTKTMKEIAKITRK